ncbi:MAG: hypothetical protein AB1349_03500 [Elusimicrobiota bacterium]
MDRKQDLMNEISKLRQRRQYAERRCEMTGRMLPACLIFRARVKGQKVLQSIKTISPNVEYKDYGYLTCFYKGRNIYKYVPQNEIENVKKLTEAYRLFCQNIQQVRELNKRIVELLDQIGEIQMEEIKKS